MESATYHMRAYEQLYALTQTLAAHDGITATLRDDRVEVKQLPPGQRRETITCAPRPSDGDRLWFWDSQRRPIREADAVTDAALMVGHLLAEQS